MIYEQTLSTATGGVTSLIGRVFDTRLLLQSTIASSYTLMVHLLVTRTPILVSLNESFVIFLARLNAVSVIRDTGLTRISVRLSRRTVRSMAKTQASCAK
jgi:hypothetical protein